MIAQEKLTTISVMLWNEVITIIKVLSKIDQSNANSIRSQINSVVRTNPKILVINMQDVDIIDSSGLGVLITILKGMRANGGKLILSGMQKDIIVFFEMTQTDKLFETCDSF